MNPKATMTRATVIATLLTLILFLSLKLNCQLQELVYSDCKRLLIHISLEHYLHVSIRLTHSQRSEMMKIWVVMSMNWLQTPCLQLLKRSSRWVMTMVTRKPFSKLLRQLWQPWELAESVKQHQRLSTTLFKLRMQSE
jgi:hypothetical protein